MITGLDRLCYADVASREEQTVSRGTASTRWQSSGLLQQYQHLNLIFSTACGKHVQKLRGL
jgi:hypothetical protein